jgi:16S rRNA A1518/A1519 N6-dimethyltransferase RsmA/KsgA/DIM1 with predicted DNA glycosylase/AP lyase activity
LTQELIKKSKDVLGFEIDESYRDVLEKIESKNLKLIFGNALEYSWEGYDKVVSNIPYYLTEGIIKKAIFEGVDSLVLIVGENFKISIEEQKKFLGVLTNIFYEVEFIEKVDKDCFNPVPRVDSWIIKMKRKPFNDSQKFILYFLSKKGKIKNALVSYFLNKGLTKKQAKERIKIFELQERILDKSVSRITGRVLKRILDKI